MIQVERDIKRKLRVLDYAQETRNVSKTCRYFGISRQTFYEWKRAYARYGEQGLVNSKPCPKNPALRTPPEIETKILYLRRKYHLGQVRIASKNFLSAYIRYEPTMALSYTDDVDLNQKLEQWEKFYNYHRPHGGLNGKTPYEILRDKLQ